MKMTSGKDQGGNPHDEREDGSEITSITNTSPQIEKLRMTDQNIQGNPAEQGHGNNEELSDNPLKLLRQKVMSPPLTDVQETLYVRFDRLEPKEFEGTIDLYEVEDWLHSTQAILEAMEMSDREKIQCDTYMLKKEARYW